MNRRSIIKSMLLVPFLLNANAFTNNKIRKFEISMFGDLDDDLIVLKSTPANTSICDIHQMHNSKGTFVYNNVSYKINHNPGFIKFRKEYKIIDDEIFLVCLANEREDAGLPKNERVRTHYKNEKLYINKDILLESLMPEQNSVPNYPLWFAEDDIPRIERKDENGNTYNYYNLFENTIVQMAIVVNKASRIKINLFDENDELKYSYEQSLNSKPKLLKSKELLANKLNSHPFTEVNNILNLKIDEKIPNNNYINSIVIEKDGKTYSFELPYPMMYPNLITGVSVG